ncbi:hypothetical protein LJG15_24545 [Pseudomonas aeruginosa]|uniref:hypothetical protein n=1 Tax=Pseudomonas aeruginosa TaxID=287 RepID=UPI001D0B082E|nr:hypothetical protein [Pseudomonas aeruginosa]MCC0353252.1 hypothetical protein [Pseudomonas aeruginosa]
MSNELTDVRCPCGAEFQADSYDAGFIAGSGMCQNCDAALPPKDICTCPSGDGSLRWPCPAHPAEQAGGDERAAFESRAEDAGSDISRDDFGNYVNVYVQTEWEGWQARAALAQPSPAPDYFAHADKKLEALLNATALILESPGHDAAHYWAKCLREYDEAHAQVAQARHVPELDPLNLAPHAEAFNEAPAEALKPEQAEAERPIVSFEKYMQVMYDRDENAKRLDAALAEVERLRQFERICEGLPQDAIDGGWTVQGIRCYAKRLEDQLKSALARVAELEKQEPVATVAKVPGEDWNGLHFYRDLQGIPSGTKLYTAPVAQAQHSVPDELRAICMLVAETGIKYGRGRHRAVAADECRAVVNAVLDADLSVGRACEYAGCCDKAHPGTSLCIAHHSKKAQEKLLAAAPGKEGL